MRGPFDVRASYVQRIDVDGSDKVEHLARGIAERVYESFGYADEEILCSVVANVFDAEFNEQVVNVFTGNQARMTLTVQGESSTITVDSDNRFSVNNPFHLESEAVYFDDPFVLDELGVPYFARSRCDSHRHQLARLAGGGKPENSILGEMIVSDKLEAIYELMGSVCDGSVKRVGRESYSYVPSGIKKGLNVRNISTGMKTFVLLKMLLQNGIVEERGTIIFDEPEIHLHPEWQVVFAEMIVLLQKSFGLHVLMNTHSPYFLQAIEVMSKKYGVDGDCRYYLAERRGRQVSLEDVTRDREPIYEKLAHPLQDLARQEALYV